MMKNMLYRPQLVWEKRKKKKYKLLTGAQELKGGEGKLRRDVDALVLMPLSKSGKVLQLVLRTISAALRPVVH
jgi:hypothetical protein